MKHIESHIKINKTKAIPRHVVGKPATVKNYRKLGMFFYCSLFFFHLLTSQVLLVLYS